MLHMEKTWLINETTLSMWQLVSTHVHPCSNCQVCFEVFFLWPCLCVLLFELQTQWSWGRYYSSLVCRAHGEHCLHQGCHIVLGRELLFVGGGTKLRPMRHLDLPLPRPRWNSHSCWEDYTHTEWVCVCAHEGTRWRGNSLSIYQWMNRVYTSKYSKLFSPGVLLVSDLCQIPGIINWPTKESGAGMKSVVNKSNCWLNECNHAKRSQLLMTH